MNIRSWLLFVLALSGHAWAQLPEPVAESLLRDIQQSQARLEQAQKTIVQERKKRVGQLRKLQDENRELRQQTAVARRAADEQTLSLETLQNRLAEWRNQGRFQHNLLVSQHQKLARGDERQLPVNTDFNAGLKWLEARLKAMPQALYPDWQEEKVVSPGGEVIAAQTLKAGPVYWYWQAQRQEGGLLSQRDDQPLAQVALNFNGEALQQLAAVAATGEGQLWLDPTLTRAIELAGAKESLLDHLDKGGLWALPILAFALFALVIAVAKSVQLARVPRLQPALPERVEKAAGRAAELDKLAASTFGAQREMLQIIRQSQNQEQRDDRLFACLLDHKHKLEYWLGAIAITAAVSPLLGLLGTVSGMIKTFKMMTLFGAGDPAVVSGGISEALITTELGLVVAIPALLLHALLQRWVKSYYAKLETDALKFSQLNMETKA